MAESATRFGLTTLPLEIQQDIWDLVLGDETFVLIRWGRVTSLIPIIDIPRLAPDAEPGLIPVDLPEGMPRTLESHPRPIAWPSPDVESPDWETYYDMMLNPKGPQRETAYDALTNIFEQKSPSPDRDIRACLCTCQTSRDRAFRHIIRDRGVHLQPDRVAQSDTRVHIFPKMGGCPGNLIGRVFRNRHERPRLLYILNTGDLESDASSRIRSDFTSYQRQYVAASLHDIEDCILGYRVTLTQRSPMLDIRPLERFDWAMWWRPDLGARARRPEASHPFHYPPPTIILTYSAILHNIMAGSITRNPHQDDCMNTEYPASFYYKWLGHLNATGTCTHCERPLLDDVRRYFPELLDEEGKLDVLLLMKRDDYENPKPTIAQRVYEPVV